jgi:hypothetical protein
MKTPKEEKIKPCPFCGSSGMVYHWGMSLYWSAECSGDKLKTGESCCIGWINRFENKKMATESWNRRRV